MKMKRIAAAGAAVTLALSLPLNTLAAEKDQTVYVTADEGGEVEKIIVSSWLKNSEGSATIEDRSHLSNIQNVKGDETFIQNSDGSLVWQADGQDIYYQGEAQKELPVSIKLTYYLDGREIQPEALAGKSGRVRIRIDYTNHTSQKVMVDGEEQQVCTPFMMMTGMILPTETFKNVEVKGGQLISDGNRQIAVGVAFPGLSDSLKLSEVEALQDYELPEYVEITADAENFELAMSATVATTGFLDRMGLDRAANLEELEKAMDQLKDASKQLVDGSSELQKGAIQLSEGAGALAEGLNAADEGAGQLLAGLTTLNEKKSDLTAGISQLQEGASALTEGVQELQAGIKNYTGGAAELSKNLHMLQQAAESSLEAAEALPQLVGLLVDGSRELQTGVQEIQAGVSQVQQAASGLGTQLEQLNTGLSTAQNLIRGAQDYLAQAGKIQAAAVNAAANAQAQALLDAQAEEVKAAMDAAGLTEEQKEVILQSLGMTAQIDVSGSLTGSDGTLEQIHAGLSQLQAAFSQQVDTTGLQAMAAGAQKALEGSEALGAGAQKLQAGVQGMSGFSQMAEQLKTAIDALTAGSDQLIANNDALNAGAGALCGGAARLSEGMDALANGTEQLSDGVSQLTSGAGSLKNGTEQLSEGAGELSDGVEQLLEGSSQLREGMAQFDEEGIQKLTNTVSENLQPVLNRLKAVVEADRCYGSFDGGLDGMESSVKFIIETAGIEK